MNNAFIGMCLNTRVWLVIRWTELVYSCFQRKFVVNCVDAVNICQRGHQLCCPTMKAITVVCPVTSKISFSLLKLQAPGWCGFEFRFAKLKYIPVHYDDVIMSTLVSQITSLTVVYSIVYSGVNQRKHQSSASLTFVRGIHRDRWIPRTKSQ